MFGDEVAALVDDVVWNHRTVVDVFLGAPGVLVPTRLKGRLERAFARVELGAREIVR